MGMINRVSSISGNGNVQSRETSLSNIKSKNLESQLTSQQQRLNKISGDSKMSEEEKIKERQKIQQQIAELNRKLRMEQIKEEEKEQKAEKKQKSKIIDKEELQKKEVQEKEEKENTEVQDEKKVEFKEISPEDIYNMLNVNSTIQRERIMGNVERKKNGMENVLESEIKMDDLHGIENTVKKEQLSEMRREKPIQIKVLGVEEETTLGINNNRKIVIKDN